jgi:rfaE bifunctional protein kinase chain/domain
MVTQNAVPDFAGLRVAVVGDLIADAYLYARPTRLSREAPVMVMRYVGEEIGAGGAANVARNLAALEARVLLLGGVGRDANGRELLRIVEKDKIDVAGVTSVPGWVTPTKTRILGAEPGRMMHQVLRVDREPEAPLAREVRAGLADAVRSLAGRIDALLVSDYGYGMADAGLADAARAVRAAGAVVVLDPRRELDLFHDLSAFTPNLGELALATNRPLERLVDLSDIAVAADELRARARPDQLLVTLGNRGMALFSDEHPGGLTVRASGSDSVVDVSGAGDSAAAAFTLALAAGTGAARAMRLANAAAGVVVMEHGTATCSLAALRSALADSPQPALRAAAALG